MQLDDAAHILGAADFFSVCNLEQRRMLAFASDRRVVKKGDVLFRTGDVIEGAFVLISGSLTTKPDVGDDDQSPVEISQPGTVIGELALIAKHPRRVSLYATSDTELLLVPRETFAKLMVQFPDLAGKAAALIRADIGQYVNSFGDIAAKIGRK